MIQVVRLKPYADGGGVENCEERVLQEFIIGLLDPPVKPLHEPLAAVGGVDAALGSHGLPGDVKEARDRPLWDAVMPSKDHHRLTPPLQPAILDRIDQDIQVGGPLQPPPEIVDRVLTLEHAEHPVAVPLVIAPGPVFVQSQSIAWGMIAVAGTAPGLFNLAARNPRWSDLGRVRRDRATAYGVDRGSGRLPRRGGVASASRRP